MCVFYDYKNENNIWVRYPHEVGDVYQVRGAFLLISKHDSDAHGFHCEPILEMPELELVSLIYLECNYENFTFLMKNTNNLFKMQSNESFQLYFCKWRNRASG